MIKEILVHSSRYFSASIISALAAFLMTRFYTETFTPSEFGVMIVYLMVFEYVVVFGSLSTEGSIARKMFDYKDNKLNVYLSTMFWFYCGLCVVVFTLGLILLKPISNWVSEGSEVVYVTVLIAGITSIVTKFFNTICVNNQKSKEVSLSLLVSTVINHPTSILVIEFFGGGIVGRFIGVFVGGVAQAVILSKVSVQKLGFSLSRSFDVSMLKETLHLALPTICSSILILLLAYADRFFLKSFSGDEAVGLYGLALIIGKLITLTFNAMFNSVFPMAMKKLTDEYQSGMESIENLAKKYYLFLFVLLFVVNFISPIIYMIVANGSYNDSKDVFPFVVIGIILGGLYKIPSIVLSYHKIVWFYLPITVVSFSTNALLNYVLIPQYGIVGAGFSTCIGYLIYSILVQAFSWKFFTLKYKAYTAITYIILSIVTLVSFLNYY